MNMRLTKENRKKIRREFESFRDLRFPARSSSMFGSEERKTKIEAAHLHLDLVEYDAYIAGYVSRLCKGLDVNESSIYFDEDLGQRLKGFGERNSQIKPFTEEHLNYLKAIHRLVSKLSTLQEGCRRGESAHVSNPRR